MFWMSPGTSSTQNNGSEGTCSHKWENYANNKKQNFNQLSLHQHKLDNQLCWDNQLHSLKLNSMNLSLRSQQQEEQHNQKKKNLTQQWEMIFQQ